jgi:hypothetical protein
VPAARAALNAHFLTRWRQLWSDTMTSRPSGLRNSFHD